MSNKTFGAYAKIKKDILIQNLVPPEVDKRMLEYYKFAPHEKILRAKNTIYNIDIKSAYPSVLINSKIITTETWEYLASLEKKDRLACLGMLAANKIYYFYNQENKLTHIDRDLNPLSGFFNLCIFEIQNIMNEIRAAIGNDFLFYWVDGIYFNSEKSIPIVKRILEENEYKYSVEKLKDFSVYENDSFTFENEKGESKIFRMPGFDDRVNKELVKLLNLHDEKSVIGKFLKLPDYLKQIK
jgi:hypothetical protein